MTDKLEEQSDIKKSNQGLTSGQKFLFTMFCWGMQSWGQAKSFKTNGYDRKYDEAKRSMHTGLIMYGLVITLFITSLLFYTGF